MLLEEPGVIISIGSFPDALPGDCHCSKGQEQNMRSAHFRFTRPITSAIWSRDAAIPSAVHSKNPTLSRIAPAPAKTVIYGSLSDFTLVQNSFGTS